MDTESIGESLRQSLTGDPWHGPSLDALLADVTPEQAASHPIAGAHSIIELVLHLTAWTQEVSSRLHGNTPALPALGDWPSPGDHPPSAWISAQRRMLAAHDKLLERVRGFPPARLSESVGTIREAPLGTGVSFAQMLLGIAQHNAYHGGQIAILKRALSAPIHTDNVSRQPFEQ